MKTELLKNDISSAASIIARGGLVAAPTETVYGLAGNGLNKEAVERIYEIKGRPEIKPLSLMVPGADEMQLYCEDIPRQAHLLAERFWPGPLTIVLKSKQDVPEIVRAGGETVGLRCPDHPLTLALLRSCGVPLAAPSANPSGKPSPKTAGEVLEYFDGKIDAVIDGGECGIGLESTIIDMTGRPYRVLRKGALPQSEIEDALVSDLKIFGITGGTGTGKTTALNVLCSMGGVCIDCDEVYHRMTEESTEMRAELEERYGDLYEYGKLDRKKLGAIVFNDKKALMDLNRITHKYIGVEVDRLLRNCALSGGRLVGIDAVELISSGITDRCTKVIGITAPREIRVRRVMARENIPREYAEMRINAQRSDDYYKEHCDVVIENKGDIKQFTALCEAAFKEETENGR